jgi:uncharacterized membrane protein YesL
VDELTTPTPDTYVQATVAALWENLPMLLVGGACFSLFSAPAFLAFVLDWHATALLATVFLALPAWTALLALQAALLAGRPAGLRSMGQSLRTYWRPTVRLGSLWAVPWLLLFLLVRTEVSTFSWLGIVAASAAILVLTTLSLYTAPLLVLHDQDLSTALRNSLLLVGRYPTNTLGLLSMGVLSLLGVIYLSPALLFLLPMICGLFIVNHCRLAVGQAALMGTQR